MMWEYELTDEEYRTVVDALKHAEEDAVHSDAKARFKNTRSEIMKQHAREGPREEQ